MVLLVPLGLAAAFIGAVKGEVPKKFCVAGFWLNLAWFLFLLLSMFFA
jgi:hypothetical protein